MCGVVRVAFARWVATVKGRAAALVGGATIVCGATLICGATLSGSQSTPLLTPWGDPDLQGIWTNSTITPLERPAAFEGREFLTEEEARTLDRTAATQYDRRSDNAAADVNAAYNQFWWERGQTVRSRRTSLIVDPKDGRLPPLTADGQKRAAEVGARLRSEPHGPEDRNLAERCVTRGAPKLPGGYNNNFQIVQTPTHVAILQEMIHEVRIIPLDRRPHLPPALRLWLGDSRGRWEGETLVVETTNYHELSAFNSYYCCRGAAANLRIVERFRRVDADTIDHQFTVDDPTTFTRPFTVAVPMTRIDGPIFEYACHEGNYGMEGILRGARAQERRAAADEPR
jgi:hypothetical protein